MDSVLTEMEIDGERFESWPSSPNHPIKECLLRVEESDAVIILLGNKYGTPSPQKSGTHLEYDHAKSLQPPKRVFAYLLETPDRDPRQQEFIDIVLRSQFRCPPISGIGELKRQIKNSLIDHLARCFRFFEEPPSVVNSLQTDNVQSTYATPIILDINSDKALQQLLVLHNNYQDTSINRLASYCKSKFSLVPEIMNLVYMAQVNLAMDGIQIEHQELISAIAFWDTAEAKKIWAGECLYYNQGNAFVALKLQTEAINRFKLSLAIKSDDAHCWVNLGNAHSANGDTSTAGECFKSALNIEPDLFQALYSSAVLAVREGRDIENGLKLLNRIAISHLPRKRQAAVHGWKANALLKLGRYSEGIADAENALVSSPDSIWAWGVAGRLYALARQDDKKWLPVALKFWQRFVEKYPQNARAWAEMGYVLWSLRKLKDAANLSQQSLNAFLKSIELGLVDNELVFDRIGHLYQETENWIEAEKFYRKAYLLNKVQFGYCLGYSLMRLERYVVALPLLQAAAERHQPDAMSWHNLALCYERTVSMNADSIKKAEAAFRKAIELDSEYAEASFNLGGHYWNLKDKANATAIWKEALNKFPDHKDSQRLIEFL